MIERDIARVCFVLGTSLAAPVFAQFEENFDSYSAPSEIIGQGGWAGWNNDSRVGADVVSTNSYSGENALQCRTNTDVVKIQRGLNSGQWVVRARVFLPPGHTGGTWLILLNRYSHNGQQNWSTQVELSGGRVVSHGGDGFFDEVGVGRAIVVGEWGELRVDIDLDANRQVIRYDGELVHESVWQIGGINELQAVNLWSDEGGPGLFDDVIVERFDPATDDCNGNGEPDGEDLSSGRDTDCDGNGVPDECQVDTADLVDIAFGDARSYASANSAICVAASDIDGDGDDDLAVSNFGAASVTVFRNTGNGNFSRVGANSVGRGPFTVMLADLNGDGDDDIAATSRDQRGVSVLEGAGERLLRRGSDFLDAGPCFRTRGR